MKAVVMQYIRQDVREEHYYVSVEDALQGAIAHIEHDLGVPVNIISNDRVIYDEESIREHWTRWVEETEEMRNLQVAD